MNKKVKYKNKIEFVNCVADDCLKNMSSEDKEYLIENPVAIEYHFSYCLYIRNHYIHNRDFSETSFFTHPDDLSSDIIRMIFSRLLPEYEYDNLFTKMLYDNRDFILLRKKYRDVYGEYPTSLVEKYKSQIKTESVHSIAEIRHFDKERIDGEIETMKRNLDTVATHIESLLKEINILVST